MGSGDTSHASRIAASHVAGLHVASWPEDSERLGDAALADAILEMSAAVAALEAKRIAFLGDFDRRGLAGEAGHRDTASWLTERTLLEIGPARAAVTLARSLADEPEIAAAVAESALSPEHARLLCHFFEKPPTALRALENTDPEEYDAVRSACRDALLAAAAPSPTTSTRTVRTAKEKLEQRLDCEAGAGPTTKERDEINELSVGTTLHGRVVIHGNLDAVAGDIVKTALSKLSAPRPADGGTRDDRTPSKRRADALVEVCNSFLASGAAGFEGGERPHVTLIVDDRDLRSPEGPVAETVADTLTRDLPWTHWGTTLSPRTSRALACDAQVTPVLVGDRGVPLAMGRTHRLVTPAQRRALTVRDKGCAFPGCGAPSPWCDAHHVIHWADGGSTDLDNLVLLCGHHHRHLHHSEWSITIDPGAPPRFEPPPRRTRSAHGPLCAA
ncbi:HNH endonuclease [Rhodococcus rhodnii]|uniref:HNH nuclease domain-containing protein n=2 Tax=Rhodococcus rhodnii TaxID=38312 RepID=R7WNZ4_9NOCA|nr:HNH endonuclease signature motif containing protein [Rhodococcus rhodnii]EOM77033.1 hypothetical protein Rrhod_1653 [Rhodococcus rhodnii LMG 5362]TXG89896.1 HNH endonuclease [Rhodococcus rhodnii]